MTTKLRVTLILLILDDYGLNDYILILKVIKRKFIILNYILIPIL